MSSSDLQIHCPNPTCSDPVNTWGQQVCQACHTRLIYRYLWASGHRAAQIPVGERLSDRYQVIAPQVWVEAQPGRPLDLPEELPASSHPYLSLYSQRLHVPEIYSLYTTETESEPILLLENVPFDTTGQLLPTLTEAWATATAVRQVYWLWQILQLWQPLSDAGVATSLLLAENLRVEGWRIRLRELVVDAVNEQSSSDDRLVPGLRALGNRWVALATTAKPVVSEGLQTVCQTMQTEAVDVEEIALQLNRLLLEQASLLPLKLKVVGASDAGPQRSHNEDAYYPVTQSGKSYGKDSLLPHLAIVCDGIGGHEGGEVASQLAVQSLKLQVQALLTEVAEQVEPVPPQVVAEQLESIVRVVNNLIATQNDTQGRESRRRMGTTLVMALQLPQKPRTALGLESGNAHELYLVHIGDSRAYWLNATACHRLTVDDDVASREVRAGRSIYRKALERPDAGALTQALGTRDADFLYPTIQRFVIEEEGILLLCSDGLSDNELVEQSWQDYAPAIFQGKLSLESAVQAWINLANQKNGYDNTSVVLLHCQVSTAPEPFRYGEAPKRPSPSVSELSDASRALLYGDDDRPFAQPVPLPARRSKVWFIGLSLVTLLVMSGAIGLFAWSRISPTSFQQMRERVFKSHF